MDNVLQAVAFAVYNVVMWYVFKWAHNRDK